MHYVSRARLLGLPVVSVRFDTPVSTGWIAIGNVAVGILFSLGGLSLGVFSFGGLALGAFAAGGGSLGLLAWGGLALGGWAFGGLALGVHAANGGAALALEFALGGVADAAHANDAAARQFFSANPFFAVSREVDRFSWLLLALGIIPLWRNMWKSRS
jgi:hypothetical protein